MKQVRVVAAAAVVLGLSVIACGVASAQSAYRLEVSDEVRIEVWEKPDLTRTVSVLAGGTVTLPLVGEVRVQGSTPTELEEELARKFSLYDRSITQVSVTVTAYNSKAIYVLGEVAKPGKYATWPIPNIWDLLRTAGGPTEDALLSRVEIIRGGASGDRQIIPVDLSQIYGKGLPSDLPQLEPDDTINVSRKTGVGNWPDVIYVLGAVEEPGVVTKEGAIDLVGGLLLAGGPSRSADLRKVTIVRRNAGATRTIEVNLENYLKRGDEVSNPLLMPGDTISIDNRRGGIFSANNIRGAATLISAAAATVLLVDRINN